MQYWLDLFTGTTWDEFRKAGAKVTGFRSRMRRTVARIKPGDILLCYMTGVMRWVGALEAAGPSDDKRAIWSLDFPERVAVKPLIMLDPESGVPMSELEGKVEFYNGPADRPGYRGFVRRSPYPFKRQGDGELVMRLLEEAKRNPVSRPVDPVKLARRPLFKVKAKKGKKAVTTSVSIPEGEEVVAEAPVPAAPAGETAATPHTEIQYRLLHLGAEMGFDVWVARNDRGKVCNGAVLGSLPGMVEELPTQFNEATNKTIELIDVLWLKGNSIVAAFEVECTTSIYSGLLRMSDLLSLQPNLNIHLYIVAPGDRKDKVEQEILRPTFMLREKPLAEICGFLAISDLSEKIDAVGKLGLTASLKPDFLEQMAEYFTDVE